MGGLRLSLPGPEPPHRGGAGPVHARPGLKHRLAELFQKSHSALPRQPHSQAPNFTYRCPDLIPHSHVWDTRTSKNPNTGLDQNQKSHSISVLTGPVKVSLAVQTTEESERAWCEGAVYYDHPVPGHCPGCGTSRTTELLYERGCVAILCEVALGSFLRTRWGINPLIEGISCFAWLCACFMNEIHKFNKKRLVTHRVGVFHIANLVTCRATCLEARLAGGLLTLLFRLNGPAERRAKESRS